MIRLWIRGAFAFVLCAAPLAGQQPPPSARDTVHAKLTDSTIAKQLRDETNRPNGAAVRKSVIRALADSLVAAGKRLIAPPVVVANRPPIAAFVYPVGGCEATKICTFTSTSTDDKAVVSFAWSCPPGAPACSTSTGATASTVYAVGGTYTVTLRVKDAEGDSSTIQRAIPIAAASIPPDTTPIPPPDTLPKPDSLLGIIPPALPRSVPDFQPKPCARSVDVVQVMNLQTAINNAVAGDCLELAPDAKWQGNFLLPARTCSAATQWITIRTKGITDIPGARLTYAEAAGLATITNASSQYAIALAHPTSCWQLVHLNITRNTDFAGLVYHLLVLGHGASEGNTSLDKNPTDIIVRRSWIHGTATGELIRCVAANGRRVAIVDNIIEDCHASGFDSQAVEGWNGAGPILIANNFLSGAGENVMFGGADPADSTMTPSDITIRRNHIWKDPVWKGVYSIKNIFELKNARRLLIDGNVFENSWAASQIGFAIVIKSSTASAVPTVKQGTTDLTFINNRINNANLGLNIQARDCSYGCLVYPVARVIIQNNLLTGIGTSNGVVGQGWLNPTYSGPNNILIRNNTFVSNTPGKGLSMYLSGGAQSDWDAIRWRRNVFAGQSTYAIGADCAQATHMAALDCVIGAGKWTFAENVVATVLPTYWTKNPPGNTYLASFDSLGIQPDFSVPRYPGIGADIPTLEAKTAGVVVPRPPVLALRARSRAPLRPKRPYYGTRADSVFCRRNACAIKP